MLSKSEKVRARINWPGHELPAWRYELSRRLFPLEAYPSYIELKRHELDQVFHRLYYLPPIFNTRADVEAFEQSGKSATAIYFHPKAPLHEGYAAPFIQWNLRASDHALVQAFVEMINRERDARNIQKPDINKGNQNRQDCNWRWVEFLETKNGLGEERTKLRDAKRKAEQLKPNFLEAWKAVEHMRSTLARLGKEDGPTNWPKWLTS